MYPEKGEPHHTPHINARTSEGSAQFDFNGNILAGSIKNKTYVDEIRNWIKKNQDELKKAWKDSLEGKKPNKIKPL